MVSSDDFPGIPHPVQLFSKKEYPLSPTVGLFPFLGMDLLQIPSLLEPYCSSTLSNGNYSLVVVTFLCFPGQPPPLWSLLRVRHRLCTHDTCPHPSLAFIKKPLISALPRLATTANSQFQCRCFSYPHPLHCRSHVILDADKEENLKSGRWS